MAADTERANQRDTGEGKVSMVVEDWRVGRADQEPWRAEVWQRISDYVMPRKSEINTRKTKSIDGFTDQIFDTTAIHANTTLAAGQMDFLIGGKWFDNRAPFEDASDEAKLWYKRTGEIMMKVINRSNFEMEVHSFFYMRGGFGTAHFHVEEDEEEVIHCKSEDIGTYVIFENSRGVVNKVIVLKEYTPTQLIEEYGEVGRLGNRGITGDLRDRATQKNKDQKDNKIQVLVWIGPRKASERKAGMMDALNMPIETLHVALDAKDGSKNGTLLRQSGYEEMPDMVSRWAEWSDEVYGYCPSVEVLPTIRQLNFLEQKQDLLAEIMVDPRLLYPSNLDGDVSLRAGGVTIFDEGMPNAKPQEWLTQGRYDVGQDRITFKRSQVDQAFFKDLFQLLTAFNERKRQKTKFEVQEMLVEKVGRFHPTFTRLNTEFSKPFLNRVFGICFRKDLFPEPPEDVIRENALGEAVLETPDIEFTSKIAMLLKARQNVDFMNFLQMAEPIAALNPNAAAIVINAERSLKMLADNGGVDSGFLNTPEERATIEENQVAAAQKAEQLQQTQIAAKAARDLGGAPENLQEAIAV